jgi:hypothetical protein
MVHEIVFGFLPYNSHITVNLLVMPQHDWSVARSGMQLEVFALLGC